MSSKKTTVSRARVPGGAGGGKKKGAAAASGKGKTAVVKKKLPLPALIGMGAVAAVLLVLVVLLATGVLQRPTGLISISQTSLGPDYQKNMHQANSFEVNKMTETKEGIYFEFENNLWWLQKENGQCVILCAKPDCTHEDSTCNAAIHPDCFWFLDNKLYLIDSSTVKENGQSVDKGTRVLTANPDLTARRQIDQLDPEIGGDRTSVSNTPMFHRGYIYFEYNDVLYRKPLNEPDAEPQRLWGEEAEGDKSFGGGVIIDSASRSYNLWADGNMLYFMTRVTQEDGVDRETLYSVDSETGEIRQVWVAPTVDQVGPWECWDSVVYSLAGGGVRSVDQWYVKDGYIYFFLSNNGLWRSSLAEGGFEKLTDTTEQAEYGQAIYSDRGVFLLNDVPQLDIFGGLDPSDPHTGGDTIFEYDLDGTLKQQLSITEIAGYLADISSYYLLAQYDNSLLILAEAEKMSGYEGGVSHRISQTLQLFTLNLETGAITRGNIIEQYINPNG